MAVLHLSSGLKRSRAMFCLLLTLIFIGQAPPATAVDSAHQQFQNILRETLEDLWTGRQFSPGLKTRQLSLIKMLSTGAVETNEFNDMLEATLSSLMDRRKTSRYVLKSFPERIDALFSPYLDWNVFEKALWQALSSVIKADAPFWIKVGTLAPPGTPWLNVPETEIIPDIKKLSNGKILIQIYGGGVMGEDTEILEKINNNSLTCCGCTALGVLAACPAASALLLPGLFNNYEEVDYIFEKFRQRLDAAFLDQGYELWALIDTGLFYMFSTKPVTGLGDIKSLRALTWFGILETSLFEELDINAKPVPLTDIISTLSAGRGDVYLAPAAWALGMQAYQYTNFYIKPALLYSPAAIIVPVHLKDRLQKQAGISDTFAHNLLEVIIYEIQTFEPEWKRQIRSYEEKSLRAFESKCGIQAITLPPEDQKKIEEAGQALQQKLAGTVFPTELINDIQKALAEYRKTH